MSGKRELRLCDKNVTHYIGRRSKKIWFFYHRTRDKKSYEPVAVVYTMYIIHIIFTNAWNICSNRFFFSLDNFGIGSNTSIDPAEFEKKRTNVTNVTKLSRRILESILLSFHFTLLTNNNYFEGNSLHVYGYYLHENYQEYRNKIFYVYPF